MHSVADPRKTTGDKVRAVVFAALWALMASAMLVESDVYRYAALALVAFVFLWHRRGVKCVSRDWLALLCYIWSAYVVLRFAVGVFLYGEKGTSEWLYAFPAFFPLIGVALHATRRYIFSAATLLLACGLAGLVATLDYRTIFTGERAAPLFHNNPIHAGVGCCMFFLTAIFWLLYAAETGRLNGRLKWPYLTLGSSTAVLSLVGALGAQSKGAWLALAATTVFMAFLRLHHLAGRWRFRLLSSFFVLTVAAAAIAMPYIVKVAGSTMGAAAALVDNAAATTDPAAAVQAAIGDESVPMAMRERLMLWSNALELVTASPLFGWGNLWLREWQHTHYSDVGYTLLHNGYLEILVRHGIVGLAFLIVFALCAARRIRQACRDGLITQSSGAYLYSLSFFFFCTIASNSNNRLALGESFFVLAASAVFAVTLLADEQLGNFKRYRYLCSRTLG